MGDGVGVSGGGGAGVVGASGASLNNMFVQYMARIHREEDFHFLLRGFIRLLNNPLIQTYLPASCKKIKFYQELLLLLWKLCDINKVRTRGFGSTLA